MYRYPFTPYPTSWFRVAFTDELPVGAVRSVRYLGRELLLFRGQDGRARVTGTTCPHLGANLASGGRVVGNTIACPFHGWRYDGDSGACASIPYCDRIPPGARLETWPVHEWSGMVFVHHQADREPPTFALPDLAEHGLRGWSRYHRLEWKIRMHVQEIAENAVDFGHLSPVHAFLDYPTDTSLEVNDHIFRVAMRADRRVLGKVGPTAIDITYHGMGCAIARVWSPYAELIALLTPTPIDEEHLDVRLSVMFKKTGNPLRDLLISTFLPRDIRHDFEKDIPIWENKEYLATPRLCAGDGPILKVRRWAKQFYGAEDRDAAPIPVARAGRPGG